MGNPSAAPRWISCSGNDFTLFIQSPDPIGGYTIDWGDGQSGSGSGITPPAFIQHTYTASVDSFIVVLTDTVNNCSVTGTVIMEEPVNASIQIPVGGVTATCAPAILQFINSSTNVSPSTTFVWDFGDGSPPEVFNYTNGGQTVSHTYNRGTVNCQTQVTLTAENYCSGGFPTVASFNPIQIWDIDDANITASATLLCYPDTTVTFTNTTNKNCVPQGNTFQRYEYWNFGDYWGLGYDSIVPWQPYDPPARPGYTIAYPGIGSYTVMMVDSNYCGLDTAYITVNIVPPPDAALSANMDTVCAGDPVTFFNFSSGGANSYSWNFGDGSGWIISGGANQVHAFNTPGDYVIQLAANITGGTASCTDTASFNVHVLSRPNANFTLGPAQGCDTLTVSFTNTSVNAVSWQWNFGNSLVSQLQNPPSVFYNAAGTYNVMLTVTGLNGCDHTFSRPVNVYQTPVASFTPANACEDEIAQFLDNSSGSANDPVINWSWNFGDGGLSSVQNPTHVFQNTGVFNVVLTATTAHCSGTDTTQVTVSLKPQALFNTSRDSGCSPLNVSFANISSGGSIHAWNFGDGGTSSATSPSHTFLNNGTSTVLYSVSLVTETAAGCKDTIVKYITVFPNPVAAFSSNANPSCAPMPVTFTNTTTGGSTYTWDFGDSNGSTDVNPFHLYQNQTLFIQNFTVTLIAQSSFGCTDTTTAQVTTYPEPQFGFNSNPDSGCSPLSVTFPSVIGAVLYQWDFGDGGTGTGPTPSHTYYNSTTNNVVYTVTLIATNPFGCIDTSYGQVTVNPDPNAQFSTSSANGCQPHEVTFSNMSTGGSTFLWDLGDGDTSTTNASMLMHTYDHNSLAPQTYFVKLTVTTSAGCTDTAVRAVVVYPKILGGFTSDSSGCAPVNIQFANQSQGASTYQWDFGDGATDVVGSPSHTFTNTGTSDIAYTVTLIATSAFNCIDTVQKTIIVHPTPVAAFTATPVSQVYPSSTITLVNNSSPGIWNYLWYFGDTSVSTLIDPGTHQYATWGEYTVALVTYSQFCSDTSYQEITIIPPIPISDFTGSRSGCKPVTVSFQNRSVYATSWLWEFGDGSTSNLEDPIYTYSQPGVYSIRLTSTGPGGTSNVVHIDSVRVYQTPEAHFTFNPKTVYIPNQPVLFYNLSEDAQTYSWDFGDGAVSTEKDPEHYYTSEGQFDVTLIASTAEGCTDTFLVAPAVVAQENGDIIVPNAFTPNQNGPNGGVIVAGNFDNDVFHPLSTGVTKYRLSIFNRWGELIFESVDINIGWDGYYRDKLCEQDVYIWKIEAQFSEGKRVVKTGDVLLLR